MVSNNTFRKLALAFPETVELPHFERASFRVNKKIFSTLLEKENLAMVKLSPVDQSVFCDMGKGAIFPVPGSWGKQGATYIHLKKVVPAILKDALAIAYKNTAPKKLVAHFQSKES